ncbi:L-rhamnose mutarotase [Haematomicrobium sanguinis]|uniref:L-rhamnose mutarotase n=1 Tax=Haematomicrobium sanguinis TaxID=479106 RepID=UPI00047C2CF7|nr:L-rhamnose mutarotase [Haematomicrobium sanguinis]
MQHIALHTKIREGKEQGYLEVHEVIPPELDEALRAGGVHSWRIYRFGRDLFHAVSLESWDAFREFMATSPADIAWQARMDEFIEPDGDEAYDGFLPLVWELPERA